MWSPDDRRRSDQRRTAEETADQLSDRWKHAGLIVGQTRVKRGGTKANVLHQVGIFREEIESRNPPEVFLGGGYEAKFLARLGVLLILIDRKRNLWTAVVGGAVQEYAGSAIRDTCSTVVTDAAGLIGPEDFAIVPGGNRGQRCEREFMIYFQVKAVRLHLVQIGAGHIDIFPSVCGGIVPLRIE